MKELSTEEKAKAYDEVREKIAIRFGSNVAYEIFSEFEESIDERVKKVIRQVLNESTTEKDECYSNNRVTQQEVFAWLEKQGENNKWKPTDEEMKTILQTEYEKGRADAIAEVQKSAWSEEEKKKIDNILNVLIDYKELEPEYFWLKSLKERVQPKQEWSEEDNINFKRLLYFLDGGNLMQDHKIKLFIWVESLKERYTWKPSDEQMDNK